MNLKKRGKMSMIRRNSSSDIDLTRNRLSELVKKNEPLLPELPLPSKVAELPMMILESESGPSDSR